MNDLSPQQTGRIGGLTRAARQTSLQRRLLAMRAGLASQGHTMTDGEFSAFERGFQAAMRELYGVPVRPPRFATKAPSRDLANPAVRRRMDEAEREKRAQIAKQQQYKPT